MTDQREVIKNAQEALKRGFHAKAAKIAKDIEDKETREFILDKAAALKKSAQAKARKARKAKRQAAKPKDPTPQDVLDAYDNLISKLAALETLERQKSRPYRFYFFHRNQVEQRRKMFAKGMRGYKEA